MIAQQQIIIISTQDIVILLKINTVRNSKKHGRILTHWSTSNKVLLFCQLYFFFDMHKKQLLSYTLLILNIFSVIAILLSLFGSVISPVHFSFLIYFSLGFPVIVGANVLFTLLWLVLRRWYFFISFVALLISSYQISTLFPVHIAGKVEPLTSKSLVVVSYNTMTNAQSQKHLPSNPNKVIEYLLSANADIICIQEYFVKKDKAFLTPTDIDSLFKSYPYKYIKFSCDNYDYMTGLATFSKYPIIRNERIKYESIFNASIYSDILVGNDTIRVFNNHLESNRFTGNDLLLAQQLKNDFNSEELINTTKYFSQKLTVAYPVRAKQADIVAEIIKSTPYKTIVCGDFNDVPISYSYTTMKGNLNDGFTTSGTGFGSTYNSSLYKLRLDYIFYDDNFEVEDFQIGTVTASDHFPIKCRLEMK